MAKQQQFIDLFAKCDSDADGEISQEEFISIITQLEVPHQYPGTVTKMIRRLNYKTPEKSTLNFEQAREYFNSFESTSKHEIWKAKNSLLNKAEEIKQTLINPDQVEHAAPSAAPGCHSSKEEPDKKPQEAHLSVLIGPAQPVYSSEVDIQVEKIEKGEKVKPFIKLVITSRTEERAKELETVFKDSVTRLIDIFASQEPDFADVAKNIHINSIVSSTKTTFFITTANEDVVQYIQLLTEFFELTFDVRLTCKGHLRFEFDYDFEKFITEESSSFYDIFTRNNRLSVDVSLFNLLFSIRKFFKSQVKEFNYMDQEELMVYSSLLQLEAIEGDFEFENADSATYETETKAELKELLLDLGELFGKLRGQGMKVQELIELLDDTISIELNGGEWKASAFLRLKNFNKVFLEEVKAGEDDE